jgi:hypothetical protein
VEIEELPLKLEIEGGWLHERIDEGGKPVSVVTRVNAAGFNEFWLQTVCS